MEKFNISHNTKHKPRNRTEAHMIAFIKEFLAQSTEMSIEQVREEMLNEVTRHRAEHKNAGAVVISELSIASRYAERPHVVSRRFALIGRGRNTVTVSVREQFMRDSLDGYKIVS